MGKTRKPPGQNVKITAEAWYQEVVGDPDQPPPERLKGRHLALLHAMEQGGPEALRELVESWGLVWKVGPRGGLTVDVPEAQQ
ncbi:hypothetical protein ACFFSQ_48790 [Dactylosporangium matsuzakiense]|uniref:Uncharacterized protein n=1 Tax=Nocardioides daeguensis TaxID=908359 RepID=A0ABP6VSQ1_9ACTN